MLKQMTQWLRNAFAEQAEPKPVAAQTATLETRHGSVRMDRAQLSCGAVAYLCHKASKPENAALDIGRVEFKCTNPNNSDDDRGMSETNDNGDKSDFLYAAERACNQQGDMDRATVVVFFDWHDKTMAAPQALKELRQHFPATSPQLDRMEYPQAPARPRLVVPPQPRRPVEFKDCGLCG